MKLRYFLLLILISGCAQDVIDEGIQIEIYHIHEAIECFSCKTAAEYASQAIIADFSEDISSGKIIYHEIDKSNPDNQDLVERFRVPRGYSGIFIEVHSGDISSIKEYTRMADLDDEAMFKAQFVGYIRGLLEG